MFRIVWIRCLEPSFVRSNVTKTRTYTRKLKSIVSLKENRSSRVSGGARGRGHEIGPGNCVSKAVEKPQLSLLFLLSLLFVVVVPQFLLSVVPRGFPSLPRSHCSVPKIMFVNLILSCDYGRCVMN